MEELRTKPVSDPGSTSRRRKRRLRCALIECDAELARKAIVHLAEPLARFPISHEPLLPSRSQWLQQLGLFRLRGQRDKEAANLCGIDIDH